jgi:plasmid maintenance system antidote protein VapI
VNNIQPTNKNQYIPDYLVTPGEVLEETALRLECILGRPAHFWSNLERQYQEEKMRLNFSCIPFLRISLINALTK